MSWVRRSEQGHVCQPPTSDCYVMLPTGPAMSPTGAVRSRLPGRGRAVGRLGDLWRCDDCRRLWRVGRACSTCDAYGYHPAGGQCMVGLAWRPATLWQRLRYRRRVANGDQTIGIPGADTEESAR